MLCGTKYWDRIHGGEPCNGILDPDETGLPNWDIVITDPGTGWTTTVTTDINGNWCVTVPAPGTYIVSEVLKWGFFQTFPPFGSYTVTVNCGDVITKLDFINCACPQPPGGIDCKTDSLHILSDPTFFNGHTMLVSAPAALVPPVPPIRDGNLWPPGFVPAPPATPFTQWIGPTVPGAPNPPGRYIWHRYFCVCEGMDSTVVRIRLCFKGVHSVIVRLGGAVIGVYNPFPAPSTCIDTFVTIASGCQFLEFEVTKNPGAPPGAGLSYDGSIVGPGLIKDECCECYRVWQTNPAQGQGLKQNSPNDGSNRNNDARPGADMADETSMTTGMHETLPAFDPELASIPNPSNGATVVYYTLPRHYDVLLELYNPVGRHMMTLVNGPQQEGRHSVPLDMSEVPSGFYHLRLTAGGRVYTLRLMNVK
jgi:hypothetical protein